MNSRYFTATEAAKELRLTGKNAHKTIRRMVAFAKHDGLIPARSNGRELLLTVEDIDVLAKQAGKRRLVV